MRAFILAAGLGTRMGVLTQATPKPLLKVNGHYLIEYAIHNIKKAGMTEIVINLFYYGEQIQRVLGNGSRYGVNILYSIEHERLDVGGGIIQALPLLGSDPFLIMSSDVVTNYPLAQLPKKPDSLAHLVMVDNPVFHPEGDFGLQQGYLVSSEKTFTFGSIGVYRPELFSAYPQGVYAWRDIVFPAIEKGQVTGEYFQGLWYNIGTPEDLMLINQRAREDSNLRPASDSC